MVKLMFFVDFDGTISREDVCYTMVEKFASQGWQEINHLWEEGVISTEECAQGTLKLMTVEPEELEAFWSETEIDNSFVPFVEWAQQMGFPLYILSDGYDNYIVEALKHYKLDLPFYANHLEYKNGWSIECPYIDPQCEKCGVCKTKLLNELISPGYTSVYIGDGYSDLCPARYANILFAKSDLAQLCRQEGLAFHYYNNFYDIQTKLTEIVKY